MYESLRATECWTRGRLPGLFKAKYSCGSRWALVICALALISATLAAGCHAEVAEPVMDPETAKALPWFGIFVSIVIIYIYFFCTKQYYAPICGGDENSFIEHLPACGEFARLNTIQRVAGSGTFADTGDVVRALLGESRSLVWELLHIHDVTTKIDACALAIRERLGDTAWNELYNAVGTALQEVSPVTLSQYVSLLSS